ncbi:MAG: selenoneine biosynthesis selenosugar synthase SenB [Actinomycetota bacterium]
MSSIVIAAPIRPSARSGNDVTAARWAGHLRELGHDVSIEAIDEAVEPGPALVAALRRADVLVAIHARRSVTVVRWWVEHRRGAPLVVALSGTDLYRDLPGDPDALASVAAADALIVLQRAAVDRVERISPGAGDRAIVVHQSVSDVLPPRCPVETELRVVVLAHLREVKDPLLAARAARRLPASSAIAVHHAGRAHDAAWAAAARREEVANARYTWHGELDRPSALELLASAHVLACTSIAEGGANVVTEAIALGVPVVGTRIDGNTGLLGDDHPGLVPVGDAAALAGMFLRLEREPALLDELERRSRSLTRLTEPADERRRLAEVLETAAS